MGSLGVRARIQRSTATVSLVALAALSGACGSSGTGQGSQPTSDGAAESASTTTTAAESPTTTTEPEPPPSTTEAPDEPAGVVLGEFEDADGWRYRLELHSVAERPGAGDKCIDTAPPGKTNIRGILRIVNLLDDREAPWPSITLGANNTEDGGTFGGVDTLLDLPIDEVPLRTFELHSPDGDDVECLVTGIFPSSPRDVIAASAVLELEFLVGPVSEPAPAGLELLGRFFTGESAGAAIDFSGALSAS